MFLHEGIYFIFWPSNSVTTLLELELQPFLILQFEFNFKLFCSTLQIFTGLYRVPRRFFLQYLWKRAVRITEKPYTPQRERLRILWRNPVIFTDCGEIL